MSGREAHLGGRLPLLDQTRLTPAQKRLWESLDATMGGRWANEVGFESKTLEGRFIGPFNPMLYSPDIALTFLQLQLDEGKYQPFRTHPPGRDPQRGLGLERAL